MDDSSNFVDETMDMASESANPNTERRKRGITRIVQAVPLVVTGVDALGRPFVERTSSLNLNCHGCRYQSKHYVLKNMWVTLEIPHLKAGQLPRTVRGRVAWIQRPRTVRQVFQVALELEVSGNVWGIAFPPEDWFAFSEGAQPPRLEPAPAATTLPPAAELEAEAPSAVNEAELARPATNDNIRVFPSPASATDASLQLARQVTQLVADARQQLQAVAQEAASEAVSAERRVSFDEWEQKLVAGRAEIVHETERAIEILQQETDKLTREAHAAAAKTFQTELPRWVAPQLEQLTRDLTERLSQEALAQRGENARQAELAAGSVQATPREAEEAAARLRIQAEQTETQFAARAESPTKAVALAAKLLEETAHAQREALQQLSAGREALQEHSQNLETLLSRASETERSLESHSAALQNAQQHALAGFHSQLDEALRQNRGELRREAAERLEQINASIHSTIQGAANRAVEEFRRQAEASVQPHITQAEEAVHRLAGGRALLDAALTLQQDRIRATADEAFAESIAHFRENLGSVEQLLRESSQSITAQFLTELQEKAGDLKHLVGEELQNSAEWYEKTSQTQIQNQAEKAVAQTENEMRERAREISGVFATQLDHSSRNFIEHAQTQMEEAVRDSFKRARALFAEVTDTTTAAFTDGIQRAVMNELREYKETLLRVTAQERAELSQQVNAEQEAFLKRIQTTLGGVLETSVAEAQKTVSDGFAPLLQQWKSMTDAHQFEMHRVYARLGAQATAQHKNKLEGISNQWLLATVASLDRQTREMSSGIAAAAEERLRAACAEVVAGVGDSLRERLGEIARNFGPPTQTPPQAKSASTGEIAWYALCLAL